MPATIEPTTTTMLASPSQARHQPLSATFLLEFITALIRMRQVGERVAAPCEPDAALDTLASSFTIDNRIGNFELSCRIIASLDAILDAHPARHVTACNVLQHGTAVTFTLTLRTRV